MRYQSARPARPRAAHQPGHPASPRAAADRAPDSRAWRQRLNGSREDWLRITIEREFDAFPGEFAQLRRALTDPGWQNRCEALRSLRSRSGRYTPADLVLIHDGLGDSACACALGGGRMLGQIAERPPAMLIKTLSRVALHDCDAETRFAAARAVGALREHVHRRSCSIIFPRHALFDEVRLCARLRRWCSGQLGDLAGAPILIKNLTRCSMTKTPMHARRRFAPWGRSARPQRRPR